MIELKINDAILDISADFSIRLNRQLLNPSELNTKDAQFSYSLNLPATELNNKAFNLANVEEIKNKFTKEYKAELVINSINVFRGLFRLSEVSKYGYKGNLYIPAIKSVKDIFGDLMLNKIPEYRIPFKDFSSSVTSINEQALEKPQMAIFPFILYGVLPKISTDKSASNFTPRDVWDNSVRLNMQDVPPSINPLLMLKHLFESAGYILGGSAFNDTRLLQLYQSYKNPSDYVQPWNYGHHGKISIAGVWSSTRNMRRGGFQFERGVNQSNDYNRNIYSCDLLDAVNTDITIFNDPGGNVLQKLVKDADGVQWNQTQIRVPSSGFYKVSFNSYLKIYDNKAWRDTDPKTGVQHMGGNGDKHSNDMLNRMYEVKLLRDRKTGDFGLSGAKLDGGFYETNQNQNYIFNSENIPKYFPEVTDKGQINFIDPLQNNKFLLGFGFGAPDIGRQIGQNTISKKENNRFYNPRDVKHSFVQIEVAKPGLSWNLTETTSNRVGIDSPGFWKYGRIGSFDNEGDNPNKNIDFSTGTRIVGKILNSVGDIEDPTDSHLMTREKGFYISKYNGLLIASEDWETSGFIPVSDYSNLKISLDFEASEDAVIIAFYDEAQRFIGIGAEALEGGSLKNSPLSFPTGTFYVRVCGSLNSLKIEGGSTASDNVILYRLKLDSHYTYELKAAVNYEGLIYVHRGGELVARERFSKEGARFTTEGGENSYLTLYLKNKGVDIRDSLSIERSIDEESGNVTGWEKTSKYYIKLKNSPDNFVYRNRNNWEGNGQVNAVIWLEAGELLTVASVSEEGLYRRQGMHTTEGWTNHQISFNLELTPFRVNDDWLKVDGQGHGKATMDWGDAPNFDTDSINLMGFLPSDIKANDYIENFAKAFNLKLYQKDAKTFYLDVKQTKSALSNLYIDLDPFASLSERTNTPLGIPSVYKIGYSINEDEEGFKNSKDDGGGEFRTGSIEGTTVEQKSTFSYNWFKPIKKEGQELNIPIISKSEAWEENKAYNEAMSKKYTDLPLRFWYAKDILNGTFKVNNNYIKFMGVSEKLEGSALNYKNVSNTILTNYFNMLGIGSASHYTEIEIYLKAYQYAQLDGSKLAKFNGDLYYVAQIDGFDPTGKNKTKIKLIRKI